MTAKMMMLNWVQETSVSAAVVLSVGLPRLVSRAWVVVVGPEAEAEEEEELDGGRALGTVVEEGRDSVVERVGGDVGASVVLVVLMVWAGVRASLVTEKRRKECFRSRDLASESKDCVQIASQY